MIQLSEDELKQFEQTWREMQDTLKQLKSGNSSRSQIHIYGGGVGIWIATTACLIMLGVIVVAGLWMSTEVIRNNAAHDKIHERVDANDDYLNAIFQQVPEIKKQVDADRKAKQEKK